MTDKTDMDMLEYSCERVYTLKIGVASIPVFVAALVPLAFGADWAFLELVVLSLGLICLAVMLVGCSMMYSEMYWDIKEKEWNRLFGRR